MDDFPMDNFIIENLEFEKYHGLSNDYILINDNQWKIPENKKRDLAIKLCEFHTSLGGDGLIFERDAPCGSAGIVRRGVTPVRCHFHPSRREGR